MEARAGPARQVGAHRPGSTPGPTPADEAAVRSWVFRNRHRLEALLGRASPPPPPPRATTATPRVVVLQPARRLRGTTR